MITSNYQVDGDIYSYADKFFCDSSDDKPSNADAKDGLINGSILEETDTGKTYIFDKKANKWTEKSAGGGTGGSTTLAGLTDVDISNPTDGQTLIYDAASSKWVNGSGGGDVFVTLGTISAATVAMTYDEEEQVWVGNINTDIITAYGMCAGRNMTLKIDGQLCSVELVQPNVSVGISETAAVYLSVLANEPITLDLTDFGSDAPVITDLSMEVYAPIPELEVFLSGSPK